MTTRKERHLQSAFRKMTYRSGRQWTGYLTPCEILALIDDGAMTDQLTYYKTNALEAKSNGYAASRWVYFDLTKTQYPDKH